MESGSPTAEGRASHPLARPVAAQLPDKALKWILTGLSAAIALAERVVSGGQKELDDYLGFLKGGCSKYPLDLLRGAGVDMEQPHAVDTALGYFERLVGELDELL